MIGLNPLLFLLLNRKRQQGSTHPILKEADCSACALRNFSLGTNNLKSMNDHMQAELEREKDNLVQVIVSCNEYEEKRGMLEKLGRIKYHLPMIQSYVLEVRNEDINNILNADDICDVEMDKHISSQMNRARDTIGANAAHKKGITGKGIGVAILDTGISYHPDLCDGVNRVTVFRDFINRRDSMYDDNGHGTHVAGIIGGNGRASNGMYCGVAPECNIIVVKVLNHRGNGNVSDVLAGLQWIMDNKKKYNIRVVNISVGTSSKDGMDEKSMLVKGVDALWDSGVVVVVAAGNNGPGPKSISTPGISRKVITVGASDDNIAVELSGNKSVDYSGRGPTPACIKKPDIVAPGSNIISCNGMRNNRPAPAFSLFNQRRDRYSNMYVTKSGTSMATPLVTGAVALLLSKEPELTTLDVKMRIRECAKDLGRGHSHQGWGLLDIEKLLRI